jgi:hypothetical protein
MSAPFGSGAYQALRRTSDGSIDAASEKILNVANGTDNGDAVNKGQLDSAISGVTVPSGMTINPVTGDETLVAGLFTLNVIDASSASCACTFPAASEGKTVNWTVKDATNAITFVAGSGDTLTAGVPTAAYTKNECGKAVADGDTNWYSAV